MKRLKNSLFKLENKQLSNLYKIILKNENFSLMILAAGYGKRMKYLTHTVPKPLLKINNRELLSYNIDFYKTRLQ